MDVSDPQLKQWASRDRTMQNTIRFPRVRLAYSSPAGSPLLQNGRVAGGKPFLPEGVPGSLAAIRTFIRPCAAVHRPLCERLSLPPRAKDKGFHERRSMMNFFSTHNTGFKR